MKCPSGDVLLGAHLLFVAVYGLVCVSSVKLIHCILIVAASTPRALFSSSAAGSLLIVLSVNPPSGPPWDPKDTGPQTS